MPRALRVRPHPTLYLSRRYRLEVIPVTNAERKAKRAAYDAAYYRAHKNKKAAYYRAHRAEIATYKQAHKAESAARQRVYKKAHPDKIADDWALRRARKRGATVERVERAVVYERDKGRCHLCDKKVPKKGWHLDHIVPLSRGGEHSYRNVAVSCPRCNLSKYTKKIGQLWLIG